MNRVRAFIVLLAAVILLAGCTRADPRLATPRDTLAAAMHAVRENDYELFKETLAVVDGKPEYIEESRFDDLSEDWTAEYEIIKEVETVKGREAAITVKMEYQPNACPGKTHETCRMYFQKEGADWKFLVSRIEKVSD